MENNNYEENNDNYNKHNKRERTAHAQCTPLVDLINRTTLAQISKEREDIEMNTVWETNGCLTKQRELSSGWQEEISNSIK